MGYSFTWPFVRLICGSDIAIGAYVHYPTISSDMVKRVRERSSAGVEDAGASKSWFRTKMKLGWALLSLHIYFAIDRAFGNLGQKWLTLTAGTTISSRLFTPLLCSSRNG